jgi:benzoylformate decarboxylase
MGRAQTVMRKIFDQHDVLFSVGADLFALSLPSDTAPIGPDLEIVHLDIDPWELGKNFPTKSAILGDPKATLPELTAAVRERMSAGTRSAASERLKSASEATRAELEKLKARARAMAGETPVQPLALINAIGEMLPKDTVVIDETVSSSTGLRQLVKSDDPQSFFGLRGGGIGWGLPASIGVKIALPDRPVIALIGDGSAMYTCQALWTAARYKIGVTFVIFNNTSYRILKQRVFAQRGYAAQTDNYVGMELNDPAVDFVSLARSLGVAAERAKTVHDATDLIAKGLASNGPNLVEVALAREFK